MAGPLLIFDTSTKAMVVGIWQDGKVLVAMHENTTSNASRALMPMIDTVTTAADLEPGDLAGIGFGRGPGFLTSIRVATSTAIVLGSRLNIPLLPVSSLEALAYGMRATAGTVVPLMDALKGQVYWAAYDVYGDTLTERHPMAAADPATVCATVAGPCTLAGEGLARHMAEFAAIQDARRLPSAYNHPTVAALGALAARELGASRVADPLQIEPLYLRPPDAKVSTSGQLVDVDLDAPGGPKVTPRS